MALTVNQEPQEYTPVYNEMSVIVESDKTAETDFRLKIEVYTTDLLGSLVLAYTGYFVPRPDTIEVIFDAQRIIENYVYNTLINDLASFTYGTIDHSKTDSNYYQIKITEQYGSPRANYSVSSIYHTAFNSALKYQNFVDYDYLDYLLALNDDTKKFLTYAPLNQYIGSAESLQIAFLNDNGVSVPCDEIEVKVYTAASVLQKTFIIDVDELSGDAGLWSCLIGTSDLENTTFTSGVKPVFDTSSAYYTIQMLDENGDYSSELRTFTIRDGCNSPYRLTWLNRLGGLDSFTFEMKHIVSNSIQRDRTNRIGYLYGTSLSNNLKAEGDITYNVTAIDKIRLSSDWLTDAESTWLEDLMTSPEIWIYKNEQYHSVLIDNQNEYIHRTQNQDGTFNIELDISFAYKSNSQRA